jgi:hypothetical protein
MANKNSLIIRPAGYGFKVTSVFRILGVRWRECWLSDRLR